jgi:hypothetical protein
MIASDLIFLTVSDKSQQHKFYMVAELMTAANWLNRGSKFFLTFFQLIKLKKITKELNQYTQIMSQEAPDKSLKLLDRTIISTYQTRFKNWKTSNKTRALTKLKIILGILKEILWLEETFLKIWCHRNTRFTRERIRKVNPLVKMDSRTPAIFQK